MSDAVKRAQEEAAKERARADAADARAKQAEEEKKEEQRRRENLSWFGQIWDFAKDNFFTMLIVGVAAWFFATTDKGKELWDGIKELLGGLVDKVISWLPEDWQQGAKKFVAGIKGMFGGDIKKVLEDMDTVDFQKELAEKTGLTIDQVKGFVPDKKAQKELITLIANANDGKISTSDINNDKTLYALMTNRPDFVLAVAKANLGGGQGGKADDILKSLREIAKDQNKLTELFTTHRDNTVRLIQTIAGSVKPEEIQLLLSTGITAGKANQFLSDTVARLLTPVDGKLPDPKTIIMAEAGKHPDAAKQIIDAAIKQLPAPQSQAVQALRVKLGEDKMAELMRAIGGENKAQDTLRLALRPDNIHALREFVAVAKSFPEIAAQLPFKLDGLPRFVEATGLTAQGKPNAALTQLLGTIASSGAVSPEALAAPLKQYMLSPEVAKKPGSVGELQTFINTLNTDKLSAEARQKFEKLKTEINGLTQAQVQAASALAEAGVDMDGVKARFTDSNGNRTVSSTMAALLSSDFRNELRTAGIDKLLAASGVEGSFANPQNVNAMLTFMDAVQRSPNYTGRAIYDTQKVLMAFAGVVDGKSAKEAFTGVKPEEISTFFKNGDNHNALLTLLKKEPRTLDVSMLDDKQKKLLDVLYRRVGNVNTGGFANWLGDVDGARDFLKIVTSSKAEMEDEFKKKVNWFDGIEAILSSERGQKEMYLKRLSPSTARNSGLVLELGEVLEVFAPTVVSDAAKGQPTATR